MSASLTADTTLAAAADAERDRLAARDYLRRQPSDRITRTTGQILAQLLGSDPDHRLHGTVADAIEAAGGQIHGGEPA